MDTLTALAKIRAKRLEDARTRVLLAHNNIEVKKKAVEKAQKELDDYAEQLPELVRQLYLEVMGQKLDVSFVQEKAKQEQKLMQRKSEFRTELGKRETELTAAYQELKEAQGVLAVQEKKQEGMKGLLHDQEKAKKKEEEQKLAKIIDELATLRHLQKTVK